MPELPEVETIVRQLAPILRGRRVCRLEVFDARLSEDGVELVSGRTVRDVVRLGKHIGICLGKRSPKSGELWLCFHLRMTGSLVWKSQRAVPDKSHLRANLVVNGGSLCFYDTRRLGVMSICRAPNEVVPPGLDPLSDEFTPRRLAELLSCSRQEIKPWLMRQDRLAGIGNIYAAEILFASRIHPRREARFLAPDEVRRLHSAARRVLQRAINCCGTTFSNYRDARGKGGSYQRLLKVYGREGQPCRRCGTPIVRIIQQQRSTFFCPNCQR